MSVKSVVRGTANTAIKRRQAPARHSSPVTAPGCDLDNGRQGRTDVWPAAPPEEDLSQAIHCYRGVQSADGGAPSGLGALGSLQRTLNPLGALQLSAAVRPGEPAPLLGLAGWRPPAPPPPLVGLVSRVFPPSSLMGPRRQPLMVPLLVDGIVGGSLLASRCLWSM
ncbi:unnamed protein product [Arctogadus glacialis]